MRLIISIPARVRCTDSKSLNPVLIVIFLLILRWSCSIMLFKYLHCLHFTFFKFHLLNVLIPFLFAPLLSIFIIRGFPLLPMALFKNFCADPFILCLINKKSIVSPYLSTALYKYRSLPPTLIKSHPFYSYWRLVVSFYAYSLRSLE